jgi:hypothetical protein
MNMASYRIEVALAPGINFAVVAESVDELLDEYEHIKGNREWLVEQVMAMVPATEAGEGVGALQAAIAGTLVESEPVDEPGTDTPQNAPQNVVERVDPWSGKTVTEPARRRSAPRTEPSRAIPDGAPSAASSSSVRRDTDRFGSQWTFGLPEAPDCEHGERSAMVKGQSRAGKDYTAYKCARGGPGGDWRTKCEFFKYPD